MYPNISRMIAIFTIAIALFFPLAARAQDYASFPHCLNPSGSIYARYTTGIHGVVGDTQQFSGSDTVYAITDVSFMQCMCSTTGAGIQTNWILKESIPEESQADYLSNGWIVVPDGTAWGLTSGAYLATNYYYSCIGGMGSGDPGSSSNSSTTQSSSTSSSSSNSDSQQITHLLAGTGNSLKITLYVTIGLFLIVSGVVLSKRHSP